MTLFEDHKRKWMRLYRPQTDMWNPEDWPGLWQEKRDLCLYSANHRCQACGDGTVQLDVHHIDANRWNNTSSNHVALCKKHHQIAQKLVPKLPQEWLCPDCGKALVWTNNNEEDRICPEFAAILAETSKANIDPEVRETRRQLMEMLGLESWE